MSGGLHVRLLRIGLSYSGGMTLHTASSGSVAALDELRLLVERDGAVVALGATRLNIAYLTGIPAETLLAGCLAAFDAIDWAAFERNGVPKLPPDLPAPVRMLFEMAFADAAARAAGQPLAAWLGGETAARTPTNQTLFLTDDATLLARAQAYLARGFRDLKLRVGAGPPADDLRRLRLLRHTFGDAIDLAADANGAWSEAEAPAILAACAALGLRYVEQPLPPDDWAAIGRVSAAAAVPVMLDESLSSSAAIDRLIASRAAPLAHLKLAKLGGLDRLMRAGRALQAAGIPLMVGQMNEGSVSTLAAAHAALALQAPYRELYGADGLANDPAGALDYAGGHLAVPPGPGLGLMRHAAAGTLVREHRA